MTLEDRNDSPFGSQRVRESQPLVKKESDSDSQRQSQEAFLFDSQCPWKTNITRKLKRVKNTSKRVAKKNMFKQQKNRQLISFML